MSKNTLRNSTGRYGHVSIALHWLIALTVIGQFSVGLYMVDLNYHDPLYHQLPDLHKSVGILFFVLLVSRIIWSSLNIRPAAATGVEAWEHRAARIAQHTMNLLLVIVVCLGYLISTAEGDAVSVFDWFEVPATITSIDNQEDVTGEWHYWFALAVIAIASLHALAALKHHFINRDSTLLKMLGRDQSDTH